MKKLATYFLLVIILVSCDEDDGTPGPGPGPGPSPGKVVNGWAVDLVKVQDAGGRDIIPSIENSTFISASQVSFLTDNELVIGININGDIRAYSHRILDLHEVSNETIGGMPVTVSLCPLTGTALTWDRTINGEVTTFGVAGLLYNSNLIMYDRLTGNNWAQMLSESVNGSLICEEVDNITVVETTWANWKSMYPQSLVQSTDTGFDRDYNNLPFSSLVDPNANPLFPATPEDDRMPKHERVHGIIDGDQARVYPFSNFEDSGTQLLIDFFGSNDLLIVGDADRNFIVSFIDPNSTGENLEFRPVQNGGEVILEDNEGNRWNIFGEAVSGPRMGNKLTPTHSYMGYWFSWAAIFPSPDIFTGGSDG